jgi:hypothetical protein
VHEVNDRVLRNVVRKIVAEAHTGDIRHAMDNDSAKIRSRASLIVYDTINALEESAEAKLTNNQRDKLTGFLYDFIYSIIDK